MPVKYIAQIMPKPDPIAQLLKGVIVSLAIAVVVVFLQRHGVINFADLRHFIPPEPSNSFIFVG